MCDCTTWLQDFTDLKKSEQAIIKCVGGLVCGDENNNGIMIYLLWQLFCIDEYYDPINYLVPECVQTYWDLVY